MNQTAACRPHSWLSLLKRTGQLATLALLIASDATLAAPDTRAIVEQHVLPRYEALAAETAALQRAADADCAPTNTALRDAWHRAFDAWIGVSHLRFGPSETNDRAFALAFWPDPRSSTPKSLGTLLATKDPVVQTLDDFQTVSIAARGFYATEYLLYDTELTGSANPDYLCQLLRVSFHDIADTAADILAEWRERYADLMIEADNEVYQSEDEALRQLFTSLSTALEFTADTRLGRPMGTLERPRPRRAEARRSGRSLHHVVLSLEATRDLAARLSDNDSSLDGAFERAIMRARSLDDPTFAGTAEPTGRFRLEVLQQAIASIREQLANDIGPRLGLSAGFNSLDGD